MDRFTENDLRIRANESVNGAYNALMDDFDIGSFVGEDRPEWQAIRKQLVDLIAKAYLRGHIVDA